MQAANPYASNALPVILGYFPNGPGNVSEIPGCSAQGVIYGANGLASDGTPFIRDNTYPPSGAGHYEVSSTGLYSFTSGDAGLAIIDHRSGAVARRQLRRAADRKYRQGLADRLEPFFDLGPGARAIGHRPRHSARHDRPERRRLRQLHRRSRERLDRGQRTSSQARRWRKARRYRIPPAPFRAAHVLATVTPGTVTLDTPASASAAGDTIGFLASASGNVSASSYSEIILGALSGLAVGAAIEDDKGDLCAVVGIAGLTVTLSAPVSTGFDGYYPGEAITLSFTLDVTADATAGSPVLGNVSSTSALSAGMGVVSDSANALAYGGAITAVAQASATLSQAATANAAADAITYASSITLSQSGDRDRFRRDAHLLWRGAPDK